MSYCPDDDFLQEEPDDGDSDEVDPWDEDGDDETDACPYCGKAVYEDAERCPHCDRYLSAEDSPPGRKPWWVVVGLILALAVAGALVLGI